MPTIDIPYQFDGSALLPLCEVILLGTTRRIPVRAVVDTGAVYSVFPKASAVDAEIDLSRCRRCTIMFGGSQTIGNIADVHI